MDTQFTVAAFRSDPHGNKFHVPCSAFTDTLGGDIEMHFCPVCCEIDVQALKALAFALQTFKASGGKVMDSPEFRETQTQMPVPFVRAWSLYVSNYSADSDDLQEYYVYTILTEQGAYETYTP